MLTWESQWVVSALTGTEISESGAEVCEYGGRGQVKGDDVSSFIHIVMSCQKDIQTKTVEYTDV